MVVTEGLWAGWEMVGWAKDGIVTRLQMMRGDDHDYVASVGPNGWSVWDRPDWSGPGATGLETGDAGRLAAEAALRAIGVPVGEITPAPDKVDPVREVDSVRQILLDAAGPGDGAPDASLVDLARRVASLLTTAKEERDKAAWNRRELLDALGGKPPDDPLIPVIDLARQIREERDAMRRVLLALAEACRRAARGVCASPDTAWDVVDALDRALGTDTGTWNDTADALRKLCGVSDG